MFNQYFAFISDGTVIRMVYIVVAYACSMTIRMKACLL
jgi:hypothetical protein